MTLPRCQLEWGPVTNGTTTVESKSCCQVDDKLGVAPHTSIMLEKVRKTASTHAGKGMGLGCDLNVQVFLY